MPENEFTRLHVHLEGRVQGVGFRYFVQRTASELSPWPMPISSGIGPRSIMTVASGAEPGCWTAAVP